MVEKKESPIKKKQKIDNDEIKKQPLKSSLKI